MIWTHHILFAVHSFVDGPWGYFYFMAFLNNAAMNVHAQVLCEHTFLFLLGIYLGSNPSSDSYPVTLGLSSSPAWLSCEDTYSMFRTAPSPGGPQK